MIDKSVKVIESKATSKPAGHDSPGNLPLNLLVEDCNGTEIKTMKHSDNVQLWNQKQQTNAGNNTNLSRASQNDVNNITMDPNINDLSKKFSNVTVSDDPEIVQCAMINGTNIKKSYDVEDLKLLQDLLHALKVHKPQTEEDAAPQVMSNDRVLTARGHTKKSDEKKRATPFERPRAVAPLPESLRGLTHNITVTTNTSRAHVYTRPTEKLQEQAQEQLGYPSQYYDHVIEVLKDQFSVKEVIEELELELKKVEAQEALERQRNIPLNIPSGSHDGPTTSQTAPQLASFIRSFNHLNDSPAQQASENKPLPGPDTLRRPLPQCNQLNFLVPQTSPQLTYHLAPRQTCTVTSPHQSTMLFSQSSISPSSSQMFITSVTQQGETKSSQSPIQPEPSDSCYETGSPSSSSTVTSPGSPYFRYSVSSEIEQDLNLLEPRSAKAINIHAPADQVPNASSWLAPNKQQMLRPLGKAIQWCTKSAEQRLEEMSASSTWKSQYLIQFVRVVMSTKNIPDDPVSGFRQSLLSTMNTQVSKKQEKTWQLAIFVHLQFLKAPLRLEQYKTCLMKSDDQEVSILYTAAIKRKCGLVARYIAEIMHQVGFNPAEEDENGNSILHLLAREGDTHAEVMGELIAAFDSVTNRRIFNCSCRNKEGKSLLHMTTAHSKPQPTTIVLLINNGADPLLQDNCGWTALQYHLKAMVNRPTSGGQVQSADLELARKLLPPSTVECRRLLDRLLADPSNSPVVQRVIEDLKRERR